MSLSADTPNRPAAVCYTYDGTLAGFCCVLVAIYRSGTIPAAIQPAHTGQPHPLFGTVEAVATDPDLADRVAARLSRRARPGVVTLFHHALRSRQPGVEVLLVHYAQAFLGAPSGQPLTRTEAEAATRARDAVERLAGRVRREVHRMHAFVRFAQTADGDYEAVIEPAFDVLPLLADHFVARYPALRWRIRDLARRQMLVYDGTSAHVEPDDDAAPPSPAVHEPLAQDLWRTYFEAVTIDERRDSDRQRRHMPLRYHRHLPELRPRLPATEVDARADGPADT